MLLLYIRTNPVTSVQQLANLHYKNIKKQTPNKNRGPIKKIVFCIPGNIKKPFKGDSSHPSNALQEARDGLKIKTPLCSQQLRKKEVGYTNRIRHSNITGIN